MIIDTFLFNDEFDMLDIHLEISKKYVDKWIVLEASRTFSGIQKPYNLTNKIAQYKEKYGDKLEVVNLELTSDQTNLICETMMRKGLQPSLDKYSKEDIVIHGDLDEIIDPGKWNDIVELMDTENKPVSCGFDMYMYKFDQKTTRGWKGSVVARRHMFVTPHDLYKGHEEVTKRKDRNKCVSLKEIAGWHWTWMGSDELIKNKVVSCIEHQSRDPNEVLTAFKNIDTKSAINHKCESSIIKTDYPNEILEIIKQYPSYWHNPI